MRIKKSKLDELKQALREGKVKNPSEAQSFLGEDAQTTKAYLLAIKKEQDKTSVSKPEPKEIKPEPEPKEIKPEPEPKAQPTPASKKPASEAQPQLEPSSTPPPPPSTYLVPINGNYKPFIIDKQTSKAFVLKPKPQNVVTIYIKNQPYQVSIEELENQPPPAMFRDTNVPVKKVLELAKLTQSL